jgi:hypothetical protein
MTDLEDVRERMRKRLTANPNSTVPGAIHRHIIIIVKEGDFDGATKLRIPPESLPNTRKTHCYDGNNPFVVLVRLVGGLCVYGTESNGRGGVCVELGAREDRPLLVTVLPLRLSW